MLRSYLGLAFALLIAGAPARASAGVVVFQDPTNTGVPGAPAASIPVGVATPLNLFYQQTGSGSSGGNVCLSGTGAEVCGWDIHVSSSAPGIVLQSFTPNPGSDIVAAVSGNMLRANGGDPINGETGVKRIGTLTIFSASTTGTVNVAGNLYVTAALGSATIPAGATLANVVLGGADPDGDGVNDPTDNCPTVANGAAQAAVPGVGNQTDGDGDLVGNACDNCVNAANARVAVDFLTTNPWATLTGGQRDDDHDGFGNHCDANFIGADNEAVGPLDLAQFRSASGKSRQTDTCGTGTAGTTRPCAIFDLNGIDDAIGPTDLARYRQLSGNVPGPKCPACTGSGSPTLGCTAGASGNCN